MPTVPNWIAKGYVYSPAYGMRDAQLYKVAGWRATTTQVVVVLEGLPGEFRFRLDDHRYAIRSHEGFRRMVLIAPDDARVGAVKTQSICDRVVADLRAAIDENRIDASAMDAEALVVAIGRIQRAATKAMADLAEVL